MPAHSKYKPEFCQDLIDQGSKGVWFKYFPAFLLTERKTKVTRKTLYDWVENHAEFREAKEFADLLCERWWFMYGKENMGAKQINAALFSLYMVNGCKWKTKAESDVASVNVVNEAPKPEQLSSEAVNQRIIEIVSKKPELLEAIAKIKGGKSA